MLVAYFDCSGTKKQDVLSVCGYVSSVKKWESFQQHWNQVLQVHKIPYFHMRQFAQSTGHFTCFSGDEEKRRHFLSSLIGVVGTHAMRAFGMALLSETWRSATSEAERKAWNLEAYSLTGRTVAAWARRWAEEQGSQVEFIFENGDEDKGLLIRRMAEDGFSSPTFREKVSDCSESPPLTPLQAADFLAWEFRRRVKRPNLKRKSLELLLKATKSDLYISSAPRREDGLRLSFSRFSLDQV